MKMSLKPQPRHSIAISPISFAAFSGVKFLLLTSVHLPYNIILLGISSIREGATQFFRCFNVTPENHSSFAKELSDCTSLDVFYHGCTYYEHFLAVSHGVTICNNSWYCFLLPRGYHFLGNCLLRC